MGVAATVPPKGLKPQDPTKKLAHRVNLFGQPLTRKLVFKNFGPEPPLTSLVISHYFRFSGICDFILHAQCNCNYMFFPDFENTITQGRINTFDSVKSPR